MNIKRYVAPDMRRAINLVRTEHGPDAVILSSDSVDGGVEIIAAVDYDQALIARAFGQPAKAEGKASEEPPSAETASSFRAEGKSAAPAPEKPSPAPAVFAKRRPPRRVPRPRRRRHRRAGPSRTQPPRLRIPQRRLTRRTSKRRASCARSRRISSR
jgi:flagellar biosynthesis protein FlhF